MGLQLLTPKQEAFAIAVASGKSQADAYREAFNVRETTKDSSVHVNASKLMADAKISQRVQELRKPVADKAMITLESHITRLQELAEIALENGQVAAAIKAEELCGKASGIYVEKKQITGADGGAIAHTFKVQYEDK